MIAGYPEVDRQTMSAHDEELDGWNLETVATADEVNRVLDAVAQAMAREQYRMREIFATRLALHEAIANAVKHGHLDDPTRHVHIKFHVNSTRILASIQDEGPGFDFHRLLDPFRIDSGGNPTPRGIALMRSFMSWMRYNECGNCVTLCKYRSRF